MKKVKVLAMMLVLSLTMMGAAYAVWQDTLVIEETVSTGELNVLWVPVVTDDSGGNYADHSNDTSVGSLDRLDPGNENIAKNVGNIEVDVDPNDENKLIVTLTNGYPGYQQTVTAMISNNGTVPVALEVTAASDVPEWVHFDIEALNGLEGVVIDPGMTEVVTLTYRIANNAPMDTTYTATHTINAIQWNAYDFGLPDEITTTTP